MGCSMLLFDTGKKLEKAFTQEQFDALVEVLERRGDKAATREDLRETELRMQTEIEKIRSETEKIRLEIKETEAQLRTEIEKVRAETEKVRLEVRETEARLRTEIEKVRGEVEKVKYDLLKWQIGGWLALAAIMAKGFGWLGF